jgi:hypothetical protein
MPSTYNDGKSNEVSFTGCGIKIGWKDLQRRSRFHVILILIYLFNARNKVLNAGL